MYIRCSFLVDAGAPWTAVVEVELALSCGGSQESKAPVISIATIGLLITRTIMASIMIHDARDHDDKDHKDKGHNNTDQNTLGSLQQGSCYIGVWFWAPFWECLQ